MLFRSHDLGHQYLSVNYENWNEMNLVPLKLFELKRHTILGYTAVEMEEWIPEISKNMILSHHEKLDGSGYPLKQRKYELECQMIQICDSFDCAVAGIGCKKQSICEALNMIVDSEKYVRNMALLLKEKIGIFPHLDLPVLAAGAPLDPSPGDGGALAVQHQIQALFHPHSSCSARVPRSPAGGAALGCPPSFTLFGSKWRKYT